MKKLLTKKNILPLIFSISFIFIVIYGLKSDNKTLTKIAQAETPQICEGSSGNLYGYISTENLGPIYLSTESWNDFSGEAETSISFYVNYDRQSGIWSGRGWNQLVGWVDFSYDQINDIVRFIAPNENPLIWGGWRGTVDLSKVVYSSQNGSFRGDGNGSHNDTGGIPSYIEDDGVGSGKWTFEGLQFQEPPCPQTVDLFLNGTSYLSKKDCDISAPTIQWITEGVHACESVNGPWEKKSQPTKNTGTTVKSDVDITDENAPVLFKLRCVGDYSNSPVEGVAIATCGDAVPQCEGENCPTEMISPKLIEA